MRLIFAAGLVLCVGSSLAVAQEMDRWEVAGGYQYTRVDLGSQPAQAMLYTQTNGLPSFNLPSSTNASGFNIGIQET